MLVTLDQPVPFRVQQTVRRGDVTSTRVTVWGVYRVIRGWTVVKVICSITCDQGTHVFGYHWMMKE